MESLSACQHGLTRFDCTKLDLPVSLIRDCFHLGAYRQSNSCSYPVVVKLNRTVDVISTLGKQALYSSNIVIKPDLPPEILLSERWKLIQSGT